MQIWEAVPDLNSLLLCSRPTYPYVFTELCGLMQTHAGQLRPRCAAAQRGFGTEGINRSWFFGIILGLCIPYIPLPGEMRVQAREKWSRGGGGVCV